MRMRRARRLLAACLCSSLVWASTHEAWAGAAAVVSQVPGNTVTSIGLPAAPLTGPAGVSLSQQFLPAGSAVGQTPLLQSSLPQAGLLQPAVDAAQSRVSALSAVSRTMTTAPQRALATGPASPASSPMRTRSLSPAGKSSSLAPQQKRSSEQTRPGVMQRARSIAEKSAGQKEALGAVSRASLESIHLDSKALWEGGRKNASTLKTGAVRAGWAVSEGAKPNDLEPAASLDAKEAVKTAEAAADKLPGPKQPDSGQEPGRKKQKLAAQLWVWILASLALGVGAGLLLSAGPAAMPAALYQGLSTAMGWSAGWGSIFLSALRYIAGPLVFSSVITAIGGYENPKEIGSLSWKTLLYFMFTTASAVTIGIAVASLIQPGAYFPVESMDLGKVAFGTTSMSLGGFLLRLVPSDPITPFLTANALQIVTMAVLVSGLLLFLRTRKSERLRSWAKKGVAAAEALQKLVMTVVRFLMLTAPVAVFGLMAKLFAESGLTAVTGMGAYVSTVLIGLALLLGFYSLLVRFVGKRSPIEFYRKSKDAMITGFSTASSAAALPVSLETAKSKLKLSPRIADLLIGLGPAINMEGTALYQVVAALFIAQAFGIQLALGSILFIAAMLVISSLGTPGAPGAGMAILATVLSGAGIPLQGIALILGVDRLLDMFRTSANVAGDLTSAVVMDSIAARGLRRRLKKELAFLKKVPGFVRWEVREADADERVPEKHVYIVFQDHRLLGGFADSEKLVRKAGGLPVVYDAIESGGVRTMTVRLEKK